MNERTLRFRVGLFVLGALTLLAALAIFFSSFPTLLKRHREYTVVFGEAPGVGQGTPVRRSGVRIGEVQDVDLDEEAGNVRVRILVEQPHSVRRGDLPRLVRSILGGDTVIDFQPPRAPAPPAERPPLESGAVIVGRATPDARDLLSQTAEILPSTQETLNEMRKSMQRFERLAPQLEDTAREYRELARSAREMVPEVRRTNDEIRVASGNWGRLGERLDVFVQTNQDKAVKSLDSLNETVTRVGRVFNDENQRNLAGTLKESRVTLERLNASLTRADDVLANLQQASRPFAERSASVVRNLDEGTFRLNRTLVDAQELLRILNREDGTFRRFANDPSLYNNLNEAACMLARILPRVDRMMQDMQVFADKIARHPESLGLGGVVSPSSGLKEAPHWR